MRTRPLAIGLMLAAAFTNSLRADVRYVDDDADEGHGGQSWLAPYKYLGDALADARGNPTIKEIRVAGGVYVPYARSGPPFQRLEAFQLLNDLAVCGGYAGLADPDHPDARDRQQYESILSGDVNGDDGPDSANNDDNCYHVFYHCNGLGLDETAVLDGFTITGGNANGGYEHSRGGGMYNFDNSPTVINCTFTENSAGDGGGIYNYDYSSPAVLNCTFSGNSAGYGGGMYNYNYSGPTVVNCTFRENSANHGGGMYNFQHGDPTVTNCTFSRNTVASDWQSSGGGMYNRDSSPTVTSCRFNGNSAGGGYYSFGGGMYTYGGSARVTNCTFSGNSAGADGGGMYNRNSNPTVTNCTFSGNSAGYGGGMYNFEQSSPTVNNCISWGNLPDEMYNSSPSLPNVTYCCIKGGHVGEGNIDADPRYVDDGYWNDNGTPADPDDDFWVDGDYRLQADSPCIYAGDNEGVAGDVTTDLDGDERIQHCRVDMGADETPHLGPDCNATGTADACDLEQSTSNDCNDNGIPDECDNILCSDFDGNGAVNLQDHRWLPNCMAGAGIVSTPPAPECADACAAAFDCDDDNDVDLADFAIFQRSFAEP